MAIDVPFIATAQMRDVDRLMMGEFRISLLQMMECVAPARPPRA
jgi:hypothetical protein